MTSVVLVAALCGYIYIDRYHHHHHHHASGPGGNDARRYPDYETVEAEAQVSQPSQDDVNDDNYDNDNNDNTAPMIDLSQTVDQSPRVGLELQDASHLERSHQRRRRSTAATSSLPPHRALSLDHGYHHAHGNIETTSDDVFVDEPETTNGILPSLRHHHPHRPLGQSSHDDNNPDGTFTSTNETLQVFHQVRAPALTIYLVFTVTLALFPGWISELRSVRQCHHHAIDDNDSSSSSSSTIGHGSRWDNDLYTPAAFVLFNTFDLVGRLLAGRVPVHRIRPRTLVTGAFLRFLLFPLLSLCVGGPTMSGNGDDTTSMEIHSNLYSTVIQMVFATSNGFLVTLAFMYAPSALVVLSSSGIRSGNDDAVAGEDDDDDDNNKNNAQMQERSAEILNFSLSLGLLSGSCLSFLVAQWMR
eukprot:scaffold40584_cov237-Amphora_coffeaeformis.AAC.1